MPEDEIIFREMGPEVALKFSSSLRTEFSNFRLLARRKNFRRGFARIRADTRGLRPVPRGSAGRPPDVRQKYFSADSAERPANVRRTPRGYGRIRADSAANWRKSSLEKCPPTKTSLTPRFPAEKLPPRTSFRRGNNSRVRVRVRVMVL